MKEYNFGVAPTTTSKEVSKLLSYKKSSAATCSEIIYT